MATSRTGTTEYLHWRRRVLARDKSAGILTCPCTDCGRHPGTQCGVTLDYRVSRQPNSAEPDHIIPWAHGGRNTPDNGRTICRLCNQTRGKGKRAPRTVTPVQASGIW